MNIFRYCHDQFKYNTRRALTALTLDIIVGGLAGLIVFVILNILA